jgi:hypothetical protein
VRRSDIRTQLRAMKPEDQSKFFAQFSVNFWCPDSRPVRGAFGSVDLSMADTTLHSMSLKDLRNSVQGRGVKSARLSHLVSHGWDTWDTPTGRRVLSHCFEGRMKVAMDACSVPGVPQAVRTAVDSTRL